MKRLKYPVCDNCGAEINPTKWDDCEQYYLSGGEAMCKDCFMDWLHNWVESNLDAVTELAGVYVVEV